MKNPLYRAYSLALVAGLALSAVCTSCSEDALDKVNKDRNHPQLVASKFTISAVITGTAYNTIGGSLPVYMGIYAEHYVGVNNQTYYAETRGGEPQVATTYNNEYRSTYVNLRNTRIAAQNADAEKNYVNKGIAEVLEVINGSLLTDMFGDVPYSDAALAVLANGRPAVMTPELTPQATIYTALQAKLDQAIQDLDRGNASAVGAHDFIYAGDAAKWKKLAYALKARLTLQTLYRAANQTTALNDVLDYVSKSFTSLSDQAVFNAYDATNLNPFFSIQKSRAGLAASQSFVNKLIARNDPRLTRLFVAKRNDDANKYTQVSGASDPLLEPAPNGNPASSSSQGEYSETVGSYAQLGNTYVFSYHELLFIKAEALARLGQTANAATALQDALVAAFANLESDVTAAKKNNYYTFKEKTAALTAADAASYYSSSVASLFASNAVQEIMVQKYLGLLNAGGESLIAYNDLRRLKALGENYITLDNAHNASGKFPLRAGYGEGDVSANPHVQAAFGDGSYVYTQNVWWAGGTR